MKRMSEIRKYICLNRNEFTVLLSAAAIDRLMCFEGMGRSRISQEAYNQTIFALYKRNLIRSVKENSFAMDEEIAAFLTVMKNSRKVIQIYSAKEELGDYCIYSFGDRCVLATPGTRRDEYIKLTMVFRSNLVNVLMDNGILPEIRIPESLAADQQMLEPVFPEVSDLMTSESLIDSSRLKDNENVEVMIILYSSEGREEAFAAVVWQPIQDKLMTYRPHRMEWKIYSRDEMEAQVQNWMEEKE